MRGFRSPTAIGIVTLAALLTVAGCTSPLPEPEPTASTPIQVSTPSPTAAPIAPSRLPALEELVITPAGIGSLLVGKPVSGTDMVVFDPDFCGPLEGEQPGSYEDGTPVEYGRWIANYAGGGTVDRPFSAHMADGKVAVIEIVTPTLATAEGIRVGSPLADLKSAYPSIAPGAQGSMSATFLLSAPAGAIVFEVLTADVYPEYTPDTVSRIQITEVGLHDLHPYFATDAVIGGCL
ncbi:MAG TPA: hypothetical protein VFT01_08530 [Homoserinimonas sp.]|nr:hypothetical protein [Homoserinimonas sp.]